MVASAAAITLLVRVRSLVDRAAHEATPEEEARTSAVIACKLIAKHEMLSLAALESRAAPVPEPPRPKRADPPPTPKSRSRAADDDPPVVLLASKYAGRCKHCGFGYEVGDSVWWKRGGGATHEACEEYWDAH